jgi:hypothetical protein
MPHATHKARRIQASEVPHVPVRRRRNGPAQQLLLAAAVGFTTLVIASLYAATFRASVDISIDDVDAPRWSVLEDDLLAKVTPVRDHLSDVKRTMVGLAGAGRTQAEAAAILKAKIEAMSAASSTPETPETPETP